MRGLVVVGRNQLLQQERRVKLTHDTYSKRGREVW